VALMEALAAIVAGGAIFFFLAYMIRVGALRPAESRLRFLSENKDVALSSTSGGTALLRRTPNTFVSRLLSASDYARRWELEIERADLKLRPSEYLLLRLALAVATVALITLLGRSGVAFVISLPLAAIMYMMPSYWLRFRTGRRIAAINKQLVETITLITNALRAGFAFSQGIDVAAKQMGPPISVELGRMLLDINLGKSTEDALLALNERIGSDDMDMVVTAILIQRNSGGNLAEVLENVSETIRDRDRIQGEIKTLTSQQRLSGWVLSLWPLLLGLTLAAFNLEIMKLFFTMTLGNILLALWAGLWVIGVFAIRRILDIDI
jgi:tight adherence protein B